MKAMIILLIAFLALVYVYTFLKIRQKRKNNNISAVLEFNEKYLKKKSPEPTDSVDNKYYKKYVTKYNSTVDFFYKDEL